MSEASPNQDVNSPHGASVDKSDVSKTSDSSQGANLDSSASGNKNSDRRPSNDSSAGKSSGIKPPAPSRIGRPCAGAQKPAVPSTPVKNDPWESKRKITDIYGRYRLGDLQELDEPDDDSRYRRNRHLSTGSHASSMDYLWELHPRKLSEAGLSRHSDSSAVLTEDTDSFIIGQKVWVGGTKPGTIAFIGETQFAPGEWAGIVLDLPIGKNDGSVAGTRYFQCEPKKGVFSRLTRLTRFPLDQPGMGSTDTFIYEPTNGSIIRHSPVSPTGSHRSLMKSPPSLTASNSSLVSASTHVDFKIGDRVIIKSSQGSKVGTVRFLGTTEFAPGEWCGVELDDPRGKNDGSVNDVRYFDCLPNYGLFAPVSKVSKSPSKHKPGACVVHSGAGGLPPTMRRAGSKESMNSMTSFTSAASSARRKASPRTTSAPLPTRMALQDVLKEKQQHIEQLLKERDLERAEIVKAAGHVETVQQKLEALRKEYEQYRTECEKKFEENKEHSEKYKQDFADLTSQLDDERRKNEDLLFRFEEAAITKGDIEVTNETNLARIKELENQLAEERRKSERVDLDSTRLFEAEETLVTVREENAALQKELEEIKTKQSALEQQYSEATNIIKILRNELDESNKKLNESQEQAIIVAESLKLELEKQKGDTKNKDTEISILKQELSQVKALLEEKSQILEKTIVEKQEMETKLQKDVQKLQMDLSAKVLDVESAGDTLNQKETELKSLKEQLLAVRSELEIKTSDLNKHLENLSEAEKNVKKELEESRENLKNKIAEIEDIKKSYTEQISQKDAQIEEANKRINENVSNSEKIKSELLNTKQVLEDKVLELTEQYSREINDKESQIKDLTTDNQENKIKLENVTKDLSQFEKDIAEKNIQIQQLSFELEKTVSELQDTKKVLEGKITEVRDQHVQEIDNKESQIKCLTTENQQNKTELEKIKKDLSQSQKDVAEKDTQIQQFSSELNALKEILENEKQEKIKYNEQITQLNIQNGDLQRKLEVSEQKIAEQTEINERYKEQVNSLSGSAGEYGTKLEELNKVLSQKEQAFDALRLENQQKINEYEAGKQLLENQNKQLVEEAASLKNSYEEKLRVALETENLLKAQNTSASEEIALLKEELSSEVKQLKKDIEQKEQVLESLKKEGQVRIEEGEKEKQKLLSENQKLSEEFAKERNQYEEKLKMAAETETLLKSQYSSAAEEANRVAELISEVTQLRGTVNQKESALDTLQKQSQTKIDEFEAVQQKLENQNLELTQQFENEKNKYEEKLKAAAEVEAALKAQFLEVGQESSHTKEELNTEVEKLKKLAEEKNVELQKAVEDAAKKESDLQQLLVKGKEELQNTITSCQQQIHALTEEVTESKKIITQKSEEINQVESKYKDLLTISETKESEMKISSEEAVCKLQAELNQKIADAEKLEAEIAHLKQDSGDQSSDILEKIAKISALTSELQQTQNTANNLEKEKEELRVLYEKRSEENNASNERYNDLRNQMIVLTEKSQLADKLKEELEKEKSGFRNILQQLKAVEPVNGNVVVNLEKTFAQNGVLEKGCDVLDLVKYANSCLDNHYVQKISEMQQEMQMARSMVLEKDSLVEEQKGEIVRLKEQLAKAKNMLQSQKSSVSRIPKPGQTDTQISVNNPVNYQQLVEEKELAESQIQFLNSIIGDMQRKSEEQMARIEILESGFSPAAADELKLIGRREPAIAPRMYCDICEEFDLHETEDCPQQTNEDIPAAFLHHPDEKPGEEKKKMPPERPYCELCEVFGHLTEDCTEDQTF